VMSGFDALQKVKDDMMRPMYERRRHLGCEFCGTTFYGYYQKTGRSGVPNGKETPHPKQKGWVVCHTHDDVFYPNCPDCSVAYGVRDAKEALAVREHEQEQRRKNKAAAEKRKATKERKRQEYWDRVKHVRSNPYDVRPEELRDFNFIQSLLGMPYWSGYENREKPCWEQGQNGPYKVKRHSIHKGHSRSGKTHYYDDWFDMMNVDTGETWQVSHFAGCTTGGRKNIFDEGQNDS